MQKFKPWWMVMLLAGLWVDPANAITLIPMEMEFTATGRGATRVFRVENVSNEIAAVEVSAKTRAMREDGEDELGDADEEFAVYPRQMILKPGQVQAVRVQWLGRAMPAHERAYRLIAEQLPLDPAAAGASVVANGVFIRVLMKYIAAMYVVPPGARPHIVAVQAELVRVNDQARLRIVLENQGTAHRLLDHPRLTLTGVDGATVVLDGAQLAGIDGANLLAHSRRVFEVAAPPALPAGPLRVSIQDITFTGVSATPAR